MNMMHHDGDETLAMKGQHASTDFIEDHAQAIDVAGWPRWLSFHLFRCQIKWGQATLITGQTGNAKIDEHGFARRELLCIGGVEQDIGGFDVAMHNALSMSIIDGGGELSEERDDIGNGGKIVGTRGMLNVFCQSSMAFNEVHDDIGRGSIDAIRS